MKQIRQSILTPELKEAIFQGFSQNAIECTGADGLGPEITFEMRENDELLGCVSLQLFWGQLHIKYIFVKKPYRGQGIGKKLMEQAFAFGVSRGCSFAFVETMSFQAPHFYERLGFKVELIRPGYDRGSSFYYLKKDLLVK